ncbi:hypothetical protein D3C80_1266110 [compost metagenome]
MMPASTNQIPPPMENELAVGLSDVAGSRTAAPIPTPRRLRRNCAASAIATPAKIAPQLTLLYAAVAGAPPLNVSWRVSWGRLVDTGVFMVASG